MLITLNGRDVNLSKALPLSLGNWEDLEAEGVSQNDMAKPTAKQVVTFVHFVLRKCDASVTRDEVRALAIDGPEINALLEAVNSANVPKEKSSTPSGPSAGPAGGLSPT